jgi:hypothetical protein
MFNSSRHVSVLKENVINGYDVSISTKRLSYELKFFVLLFDLLNKVITLVLHGKEKLLEEIVLVVDPCGLVLDLANGLTIHVGNQKDVFNFTLGFELVEGIIFIVAYLSNLKPFFS